jgi:hypothetical protein
MAALGMASRVILLSHFTLGMYHRDVLTSP